MKNFLALLSFSCLLAGSAFGASVNQQPATTTTRTACINKGILVANGTITATASAGAATLSKPLGVITTESLTTAGLAAYTLTLTNTTVATTSIVNVSVANGTNTQGTPIIGRVTPGSGSVVIELRNVHATEALNGTMKLAFRVEN